MVTDGLSGHAGGETLVRYTRGREENGTAVIIAEGVGSHSETEPGV